jgi:1-deoxy-D-xylulose-5-phosphate reductoisomerase
MSSIVRKKVVLLGSTGSIGQSTLKVADALSDRIEIIGLAASGGQIEKLAEQIKQSAVKHVAIYDGSQEAKLKSLIPHDVRILTGLEGLVELAQLADADVVLVAIVGSD